MTDDLDVKAEEGRPGAAIVWLLYLLSIPSAGVLAVLGLVVAYALRGGAHGWTRTHFDQQVRIFWQSFWWHILPWVVVCVLAFALHWVAIFAFFVPLLISFILLVWFTVKSVFGLIRLIKAEPAA